MKPRVVFATFANGDQVKRTSLTKTYTHAHRRVVTYPNGQTYTAVGFSESEQQCRKNAEAETAYARRQGCGVAIEVVAVTLEPKQAVAA